MVILITFVLDTFTQITSNGFINVQRCLNPLCKTKTPEPTTAFKMYEQNIASKLFNFFETIFNRASLL